MTSEKLTYQNIVKHEKKISYIFSYVLPPILFVLIFFIVTTIDVEIGNSDTLGLSLAAAFFIYVIPFTVVYSPRRSKTKNKNSARPFFEKIGFEKMLIRDEMLHKFHKRCIEFFIWVVIFSVTMALILSVLLEYSVSNPTQEALKGFYKIQLVFYSLPIAPGMMVYSFYLYKSPLGRFSDSNLCYSIGCFEILQNLEDLTEIENTRYVIKGLNYYNKHLWHNLKIGIYDIEKFYTKLLLSVDLSNYTGIILSKLESENRLDLLKYLTDIFKLNQVSSISTSNPTSIKSMLPFITSIIASVIAGTIVVLFQYMLGTN